MARKKSLGRFLSTASAEKRVEKAFAQLAAAVAEFQHRYHELAVCFSSQGLDLKDYDWNDKLLHTVFLFLKDYLTVDSESALWSLLERRAIEGA